MIGYDFHPEARADLDQIHDYIGEDSPDAADRVIGSGRNPRSAFVACVTTWLPMRRMKNRCGWSP